MRFPDPRLFGPGPPRLYVIIDPAADYPVSMMEFLAQAGRQAIAVHTDPGRLMAFKHMFEPRLGPAVVDDYLLSDFPDLETLALQIRHDWPLPLEGVIPWDEYSTELGARLGELLGIRWNPAEVVHRFRNKAAMKRHLRENSDLRVNLSMVVSSEEEATEFQRSLGTWPVVVKPSEGAGSKSVFFAHDLDQLVRGCHDVFQAGAGEVLLEEYVGGNEYVVNGIVDAGQGVLVTDVWAYDKRPANGLPNVYFQTIKVSTHRAEYLPLCEYAAQVVQCLGLRRAPIHMELKMDQRGPCLIEVGARFAGGNQPLLASHLHGRSLFELAAVHYMAELPLSLDDLSYERYDHFHARIVQGVQTTALERTTALHGLEKVESLASFFMFGKLTPVGMPLPLTIDVDTRPYEVYLFHEDPAQVAEDAAEVRRVLRYT